ncbi:Gfo/Idh/MocA family oxidoreductase [Leucobacter sp. UT-8R-CII-1-4]|uniref:Gfo/Idh/MocA family protein n=1 Tax=Leucobacter sp. UT-8R-CII-1-4 TaxID=3040075 RepID=UPI0024A7A84B|nr:Gfo/Idh/MocA family oxidoreductase [Leucobacter sp. UT-8R-CII-1-4]MDI6023745.1 Gfo/Idh/MocA family oxidoreductase [Leucobacter sp. UT-8R-CII-1-4]
MTLKMGIIGLGMMGRHHARVAREVEGVELVAVADAMGDPHGVAGNLPLYDSVEALIEHGIDAAVVVVPTQFHEEVGIKLAEAGVHALIEKPIAHSVEAGQRLAEAFDSRGLIGAVGHVERFNPALMELRKRLQQGELGQVYQIHTRRQGPFPVRIADVGVVKDLGSHDIDLTAWLANSSYAEVAAQTAFQSGRQHEDMVTISAKLANGTITNHLVNWLTPFKERLTLVTGERGAFIADTLTADLTFYENGTIDSDWDAVIAFRGVSEGTVTRFALDKREPLKSEHEAFRDLILGKPSEAVTLQEGLNVLRVCEASIESAKTGQSVKLDATGA